MALLLHDYAGFVNNELDIIKYIPSWLKFKVNDCRIHCIPYLESPIGLLRMAEKINGNAIGKKLYF